jgi:hypothetical protein
MLVIGFRYDVNHMISKDLDIDSSEDPRKVHDLLKKETDGCDFSHIVLVENDEVVADYLEGEDFELSETDSDDDLDDEELDLSDED